jgi:hypothetical protein
MNLHLLDRIGEVNPQLFRELKGRLNKRNVTISVGISLIGQILIFLYYRTLLPIQSTEGTYNRYCVGQPPLDYQNHGGYIPDNYCVTDLLGKFTIINELWWLDLFTGLSIIGIFVLLVAGTYLLISDLSKEEQKGTLNFIRLSPHSAKNILWGKVLGVPSLIYLIAILALPLHLGAGLAANIPLILILSFYAVLIASCTCFYTLALLYSFVSSGLVGFQAFFGSGSVLLLLFCFAVMTFSNSFVSNNSIDWLQLFYPGITLSYLVHATHLSPDKINYLNLQELKTLLWYGQDFWNSAWSGIGFVLVNYSLWTYWFSQGLKRRFYNHHATLLSKHQSYWFTTSFVAINLGFTLQETGSYQVFDNFVLLQGLTLVFCLLLIAILSPHRQSLQDWAAYRHRVQANHRSLIQELISNEKSPATLAIFLNVVMATFYIIPAILLFPLDNKIAVLSGFILNIGLVMICASIVQWMLLMKMPKSSIWAAATILTITILPIIIFGIFRVEPDDSPAMWLFSIVPVVAAKYTTETSIGLAIIGQWLLIVLGNIQITRQLQKAGESATKALLQSTI